MLYGDTLINGLVLGVVANRHIYGHRFMGEQHLTLNHADDYLTVLEKQGKVIADYELRKQLIRQQIEQLATQINGQADISESLLEEVTSLVEWPVALIAKFEEK